MANPEHLEILKQGAEVWKHWRQEYPDIKPDLRGANFLGEILSNAILNGTVLSGANLFGANLSHAVLSGADLSGAVLLATDLFSVNLRAERDHRDYWHHQCIA